MSLNQNDDFWHILYIEDDEEDYLLVRQMLAQSRGRKIDLTWAETYEEGSLKLSNFHYDAVLVDYDLGGHSGIDLIRKFSREYPTPLILYTGRGSHEIDLEAMAAGASLYLTKNEVNPLLLERAIRYAIEIKHKEIELLISKDCLEQELAERKQAEEALRESEVRFRTMADGTPLIIWVTDASGRIEFINQAYCDYFGVTLKLVQSEGWQPLVHPETRDYIDLFVESIREKLPFRAQTRTLRKDGQWRWITSHAQPRFSESGEFLGMAGSSLDINDQKQAEENLQHYTRELERSNHALRDFTFFASHDLQEPLRKVKAFGQILKKRYNKELGDEGKDTIERMISAADRMNAMLQALLVYTRVSSHTEPFVEVDLRNVISEVLSDLEMRLQTSGGQVEFDALPGVKGDPLQLRLLFQNLIGNGLKFHHPDLPPVVTIAAQSNGEKMVEITVQDNGIGFDMAKADCIFEPFKRLHRKLDYEGSGMGLAICNKIVERHGGNITVSSAPGQGSTFRICLPAQE